MAARFLLAGVSALLVLCGTTAPAGARAEVTPPKLKVETHTLENGLQVVLAQDTSRPVVNVQVWYRVGSKDERKGRTGFAHLFEHMMFRGSANVGPEEHMRYVREAGGSVNAYTNFDRTVYWQTVPSNHLERMLWLEADRMASLVVNDENFKKEREVVKEERRLRFENPPYGMLGEWVLDATFQVYPYKYLPIGSMDDLNAATAADVKEFFDTYYVPDNAALILVGDFDPKVALAQARTHFGRISRSKGVARVKATEPPQARCGWWTSRIRKRRCPPSPARSSSRRAGTLTPIRSRSRSTSCRPARARVSIAASCTKSNPPWPHRRSCCSSKVRPLVSSSALRTRGRM